MLEHLHSQVLEVLRYLRVDLFESANADEEVSDAIREIEVVEKVADFLL